MQVTETVIPGVVCIELRIFGDERGFFAETWQRRRYAECGIDAEFVQDNLSRSRGAVLRGLHYQVRHPQGRLVTVTGGRIFDVGVDLRSGSPTFGRWISVELSPDQPCQVYLPPGVAHGFCVLTESVEILYKCSDFYHPEDEAGLLWCDPDLGIDWPLRDVEINERDRAFPRLKEIPLDRLPRASYHRRKQQ